MHALIVDELIRQVCQLNHCGTVIYPLSLPLA